MDGWGQHDPDLPGSLSFVCTFISRLVSLLCDVSLYRLPILTRVLMSPGNQIQLVNLKVFCKASSSRLFLPYYENTRLGQSPCYYIYC